MRGQIVAIAQVYVSGMGGMSGIHAGIRPDLALYLRHVSQISRRTYDTFPGFPVALTTRFPDFPSHLRHVSQISRRTYDTFPGFPVALTTRFPDFPSHLRHVAIALTTRLPSSSVALTTRLAGFPVALTTRFPDFPSHLRHVLIT
jgi:hypothetical protein